MTKVPSSSSKIDLTKFQLDEDQMGLVEKVVKLTKAFTEGDVIKVHEILHELVEYVADRLESDVDESDDDNPPKKKRSDDEKVYE